MTRISYERKTPEGWQTTIRRMVALNGVRLDPDEAREIVRYLANRQGLAPEELEPGRFEVERRFIDHVYEADRGVERACIACHSMGRVITQRRTREEWELMMATHRGLYPLVDFQAFRNGGGEGPHPMDEAIDHLSEAFPLETPEWSAWSASMRAPRLAGTWMLAGFEPGKGILFGTVEVSEGDAPGEFRTSAEYAYAETGRQVSRSGQSIVYTGYQWRGRSNPGAPDELREVMTVSRGWQEMTGRWFTGAYDELGPDVHLTRVTPGATVIAGVYPPALQTGSSSAELRVYGTALPEEPGGYDFGPGVAIESAESDGTNSVVLRASVATDAPVGGRDLFASGASRADAIHIHDGVDRIEVAPAAGMARIGGANFPKGYQVFDAIGWDDGPDGEPETEDDLRLGRMPVSWSMEEYAATYDDDDIDFVGRLGADGIFAPAIDGPNEARAGKRNNVGDVWIVATYADPGAPIATDGETAASGSAASESGGDRRQATLRARAHLIVTVPLYLKFDPWQGLPPTPRLIP